MAVVLLGLLEPRRALHSASEFLIFSQNAATGLILIDRRWLSHCAALGGGRARPRRRSMATGRPCSTTRTGLACARRLPFGPPPRASAPSLSLCGSVSSTARSFAPGRAAACLAIAFWNMATLRRSGQAANREKPCCCCPSASQLAAPSMPKDVEPVEAVAVAAHALESPTNCRKRTTPNTSANNQAALTARP